MKYNRRDYGPWKRMIEPPASRCHNCREPIPSGTPILLCQRTGAKLCGPCGVTIVVHHHNEQREGVKT